MSFTEQTAEQAKRHPNWRRTSWRKGQSGNPKGRPFPRARMEAAEKEILAVIIADAGGESELTALDLVLARQAASQLARADCTRESDIRVRLTRSAVALIDRIRDSVAGRRERKPLSAFDEYIGGDK